VTGIHRFSPDRVREQTAMQSNAYSTEMHALPPTLTNGREILLTFVQLQGLRSGLNLE
jgi:hypothetical protein